MQLKLQQLRRTSTYQSLRVSRIAVKPVTIVSMSSNKKEELATLANNVNERFNNVKTITPLELHEIQSKDAKCMVLVDVRTPEELAISRIPGALTADEFWENRESYREVVVVPYCTIGYRSAQYCEKLHEEGFEALNLSAGIVGWTQEQYPLETNDKKETKRVHVFGKQWELQGDGYEAVKFHTPFLSYAFSSIKKAFGKIF